MENAKITEKDIHVPADVPPDMRSAYIKNYMELTKGTGRFMMFAGDQRIEHVNNDFWGEGIHKDDADPEHLFRIASSARIGLFAVHRGLLTKYGPDYKDIPYLLKCSSKTNIIKNWEQKDPYSGRLFYVKQAMQMKKDYGLNILAVGYTIYSGSEYEQEMMLEAANMIYEAHQNGLIAVLWMYPRGKAVKNDRDPHLIAGAVGVGASLGADFIKVNAPKKENGEYAIEELREAVLTGGRTGLVCAGGDSVDVRAFLERLAGHLSAGLAGNATGRNVHQKSLKEAVAMCNALSALTLDGKSVDQALEVYNSQR